MTITDPRPTWEVELDTAIKVLGNILKTEGISLEAMRVVFPQRPTNMEQASMVATWLGEQIKAKREAAKATPAQPSAPQAKTNNWDDIIDGNYAFQYNGKLHFYRVSRREGKGKWAGRTFVNVQERASDELYRVEFRRGLAILHSIRENGPEACRITFAEHLGQCAFCLKSLTDENNPYKSRGAGPDCGPKYLG